ncbi:class I SAM-dependent methyltransferase [Desulfohalovibrio reitneri]|uniref:class I SAM-dependent methyltransferase n=1 Tax=Desulfohalovibrio reitneri TaxID=1307759 RepID=UPI00069027F0|nr:class I SAM-dependent methyltransferase [Desulfohalovibrio reitneri]
MDTEDGKRRLHPSVFDSDWYLLTRLRQAIEGMVGAFPEASRVLDYGCGDQPYRPLVEGAGHSYLGCDLPGNPLADISLGPEGGIQAGDGSFDALLSIQVLEHVEDVGAYLSEAGRVLRKDGLMLLSTHGWWTYHPYPEDYWRWTRAGLEKVLTDHGFSIDREASVMGMLAYSTMLRLQCLKGVLTAPLPRRLVFSPLSLYSQMAMLLADRVIPGHIKRNNSAVYLFLVRKPS